MGSNEQSAEKSGSSTVSKKVAEIWERMNKGVPKKRLNFVLESSTALPARKSANNNWKRFLGVDAKKQKKDHCISNVPKEDSVPDNTCSEEAKKIAADALAAVRNATATAAAASSRGKIEITEVRDFAGQEIEVKRLVEADSKEALERGNKGSISSTVMPVDALLEQLKKKQKLSVLDKTKKDWGEYKEENKGVEDELDKYKKSSDQYLDKVSFLERADYRQYEKERDVRLALQNKRKHDDA